MISWCGRIGGMRVINRWFRRPEDNGEARGRGETCAGFPDDGKRHDFLAGGTESVDFSEHRGDAGRFGQSGKEMLRRLSTAQSGRVTRIAVAPAGEFSGLKNVKSAFPTSEPESGRFV